MERKSTSIHCLQGIRSSVRARLVASCHSIPVTGHAAPGPLRVSERRCEIRPAAFRICASIQHSEPGFAYLYVLLVLLALTSLYNQIVRQLEIQFCFLALGCGALRRVENVLPIPWLMR
ncbi:hypothetical protein LI328DRAFT_170420 [Trichoderma asperelloides]|nr:hypothetical protein LI328DRAFT_170420 [Trichoderma asperelloides]